MSVIVVRSPAELRQEVNNLRQRGASIALVPTMGGLHEGHLSLIQQGLRHADVVVASIFVNPKQFAAHEDLAKYPRNEEADVEKLAEAGATIAYCPSVEAMYGANPCTTIAMAGPAKAGLEDKFRPHFFDGVATVVAKLFIQAGADCAMFGEKDFQQLAVVRQMARDLDIETEVIGVSTVREGDGLAMSTRNQYLSKHERHQATAIYRNLEQAAGKLRNGADPQTVTKVAARSLQTLGFKVDYVSARNSETLAVPRHSNEPLRILAAAWMGKTRLIDNIEV
jgi:pantoate--beta-alanine ligase